MKNSSADRIARPSDRAILASQVEGFLARLQATVSRERRHDDRTAIPYLFRVTPLDEARAPDHDGAMIVAGKNLSRRGMSFFHERPISQRFARVELVQPGLGTFAVEIDITWCRFNKPGWYESGGRLVRAAAPTCDCPPDSSSGVVVPCGTAFPELALPLTPA